jgi:hypothetical protein
LLVLLAIELLQARNDLRDILRACLVGDKQRIGRVDDDEVLDADSRDERLLAMDVASGRFLQDGIAAHVVAVGVVGSDLPQ